VCGGQEILGTSGAELERISHAAVISLRAASRKRIA
jgi:hypothetical protein